MLAPFQIVTQSACARAGVADMRSGMDNHPGRCHNCDLLPRRAAASLVVELSAQFLELGTQLEQPFIRRRAEAN